MQLKNLEKEQTNPPNPIDDRKKIKSRAEITEIGSNNIKNQCSLKKMRLTKFWPT